MDHERLLAIAEPLLYDLKRGLPVSVLTSTYNGGEARFKNDSEVLWLPGSFLAFYIEPRRTYLSMLVGSYLSFFWQRTHVALAFEVPGGWHDDKNATALTVLQVSKKLSFFFFCRFFLFLIFNFFDFSRCSSSHITTQLLSSKL